MGEMAVTVTFSRGDSDFQFKSAGVIRTARLIAKGEVMIPIGVYKALP